MTSSAADDVRVADRRVRRTRAALRRAAVAVIRERGFLAARVSDIAARADVNRATFYAHFADKYDMVEVLVRDEFRGFVAAASPSGRTSDRVAAVAGLMMGWAARTDPHCIDTAVRPLVRRAVHIELTATVRGLLLDERLDGLQADLSAALVSGAVFGAVDEWVRRGRPAGSDYVVHEVAAFVESGIRIA